MDSLKLKFTSGNSVPVTEARITRQEFDDIQAKMDGLQYQIDELMLEYCPDDMTDEQLNIWAENQVPI